MPNAGMRVSNTGAIGVYLVRGSNQSIRSGQTGGATYYPLGTCDTFPKLATGTPLAPVVTDLFGSTPFDHYHGGMVGSIGMNLNRFSWTNLLALVQGDMTNISVATPAAAEAGTGFFTVGKHGLRIGRNDTTACGLLFLYSGAAASRPAGESTDVANQLIGRVYHSVGLRALNITSMGTRVFSVSLDLVPAQGIINSRIEMFRELTAAPAGPSFAADFSPLDPIHTGPIGVYGINYDLTPGPTTYDSIGHCANFPAVSIERDLEPVVNDLFGDAPFDYTLGGQSASVEMDFSRMDQFNLDKSIRGNYTNAKGSVSLTGAVGNLAGTFGSGLRLWWPSGTPGANAHLTFPAGHMEGDIVTQSGTRAYKNAVMFKASSKPNVGATTLVQFGFEALGSATLADFSAT